METTFIYTLSDPRNGAVRYVGKTDSPEARYKTHLRMERTAKAAWVRSLCACGIRPTLEVIDEVPFAEWMFWEQHWIQVIRGWGFKLLNGDNGGLGHFRLTADVRTKIAATLTGRPIPQRWKRVSAYSLDGTFVRTFASVREAAVSNGIHYANIVRSKRNTRAAGGYLWSDLAVPQIDTPYVNGRIPPTAKRITAASEMGRKKKGTRMTTDSRLKMSNAARRKWDGGWTPSPESRKKMSEASKARVASGEPNGRAKLTAADVATIRASLASGTTLAQLMDAFPVKRTQLWRIAHGKSWPQ